ncbi:response regulator [Vibrio marisflavi]|uniref:Regulator of RpoS n=1 Tax=Vibrio marisflavi CECT 7928 TaxID=634439 RepID=A0ABN8E423_9VIBR|nr:response regulator [Vibrio marisflavi]CAH0537771.1 Regulator of RpoS [Vibrio marisflavi CECT 7928]
MLSKILIIDDSELSLSVMKALIQESYLSERVSLTLCKNTVDAKEFIEKQDFDLIITDIVMPEISGYELISHIKEHYQTPVLAISSGYGKDDPALVLETAKELGADKVLFKFHLQQELVNTVSLYVQQAA